MKYLYRSHKGGLAESMETVRVCDSEEAVKDAVIKDFAQFIVLTRDDVVINKEKMNDERIGWKGTRYVCVKHMGGEHFDVPQCVGMCCAEEDLPEGILDTISDAIRREDLRPSFSIRALGKLNHSWPGRIIK